MEKCLQAIRENEALHRSIPFWSWNDKLEEEELRRQIRNMKDMEMGGFFMHARGGLETEYQSEEWYDRIRACIDEGKKQGLEAWAYDENGWPSGFGGGELLKDSKNHALYLRHEVRSDIPDNAFAAYTLSGKRVLAPCGEAAYCCIFLERDDSYVDTMDGNITRKFIASTHAAYKARIPAEDFGTAMPGFFTDEPQYYRWGTPWSNTMPQRFSAAYGYPVWKGLAALFIDYPGAEEFRYDYYALCHHLFINEFIRPVYKWCDANGVKLTGHPVEENCLGGQMACCGGVMPFYQYEHIPGIDYLTRNLDTDISAKQLGSACAQLGKKQAISEMFGCCGWDVTPTELKKIAELQYVNGVNMMCQHLYPYSVRGQRKRDYPAFYSRHLPWQQSLRDFNVYFNHLGSALSLGEEAANVLVIHPIRSAYLHFKRAGEGWGSGIEELEKAFAACSNFLGDRQIAYHYGDETMLATMASAEGKSIRVGACRYDYVIIPNCETLNETTCALLQAFLAAGGKLWIYDSEHAPCRVDGRKADLSWLRSTCEFEELRTGARAYTEGCTEGLRIMTRETEQGVYLFAVNLSDKAVRANLRVKNCARLGEIDLHTLSALAAQTAAEGADMLLTVELEPGQSRLFAEGCGAQSVCGEKRAMALKGPFHLEEQPENMLTLDRVALSYDGENYEALRPIEQVRDLLLQRRYEGALWLKFPFKVNAVPQKLRLCAEPVKDMAVWVNGSAVAMTGEPFLDFPTGDIAPFVQVGDNEAVIRLSYRQDPYVYRVLFGGVKGEALRNCLCFDTEVEAVYLLGEFRVAADAAAFSEGEHCSVIYTGDFALDAPRAEVLPFDLVRDGFPFYGGSITFSCEVAYAPGDPTWMELKGRRAVAEVSVNGGEKVKLLFETGCDLAPYLKPGTNTVTVTLTNAYRNLLGPHHGKEAEPFGVGPVTFSFEKQWTEEGCPDYRTRYAFVRFGIDV